MNNGGSHRIIEVIAESIDIPESTYEKAERRYKDIGNWLGRDGSACARHDPHIFPQGSFRLGTVNRPLSGDEEYDLDLACELRTGISKGTHSQLQLKKLVGAEIESYRESRGIQEEKEEKHRCWRLGYQDQMKFHLDIVPCIPEEERLRQSVKSAMLRQGSVDWLAQTASAFTVAITDDRHPGYRSITNEWNISNPEGYARWFESRMKLAEELAGKRVALKQADVDNVPVYKWKMPLQRCVQILKRHRDVMFADRPEVGPISVVITTLAARAYAGESTVDDALRGILKNAGALVFGQKPRIANPVDPAEDFADRWGTKEGSALKLEQNFRLWLVQARADFDVIGASNDPQFISEQATKRFAASPDTAMLKQALGISSFSIPSITGKPKSHDIVHPAKPWTRLS